jgi:phage replication O-like protein O
MVAMVNPQKEDGYTPIANELLEAIAGANLGGGQVRILLCLLRNSYGYNRKHATMSGSEFAVATSLHPKVVARELRELESRRVIIVLRQEGRTSTYQLQKDYTRWATGNQNVPGTGNEKVPTPEPKRSRTRNQNVPGLYKEEKDNSKDSTEPNGSAPGGTLRERYERKYQEATNKVAVIGELFSLLLGGTPDHRRLGAMAKGLNSGGKLMDLIIEASRQRISDDPHDYLAGMIKRHKSDVRPGKSGQSDHNSSSKDRVVV